MRVDEVKRISQSTVEANMEVGVEESLGDWTLHNTAKCNANILYMPPFILKVQFS